MLKLCKFFQGKKVQCKKFVTFDLSGRYKDPKDSITTAEEWLEYHGFTNINQIVRKHVPAGYDYGDVDIDYQTFPLLTAINWKTNPILIKSMLEAGADPNMQTDVGPALISVIDNMRCTKEAFEVIKVLIDGGADPNNLSKPDRSSALHEAAYNWSDLHAIPIIQFLLERGANPNTMNRERKKPRDCVIESHQWTHRKNLPYPQYIIDLLDSYNGIEKE